MSANRNPTRILKLCSEIGRQYSDDFIGWVNRFISFTGLSHQGLTFQQEDIGKALITDKNVCVSAGGGIGKSAVAALLCLWFLSTHPHARIPTTAPSGKQLKDILWSEISFWLRRCELRDIFELRSEKLYIKGFKDWYAVARTVPRDTSAVSLNDTLAGFHSEHGLLVIVDEASGVPDAVFTALEGAMTQANAYILLISNPVSTGGYYYDTISDPEGKGKDYKVLYFDARHSPLVDKKFEERIITRYGKDHPMYRAKVLGLPISLLESVVIPPERFDRITSTNCSFMDGDAIMAVDVGGMGDLTVFCHRKGNSFIRWDEFPFTSEPDIEREVMNQWERLYKGKGKFTCVVDAIGKGSGVYRHLLEKGKFDVIGHMGSEKSEQPTMFRSKRAEGFYKVQKSFDMYHFPVKPPERLKKELANLVFDFATGPIDMEPKKKFVSRYGFSPDFADAMMMTEAIDLSCISIKTKYMPPGLNSILVEKHRKNRYGKFGRFVD